MPSVQNISCWPFFGSNSAALSRSPHPASLHHYKNTRRFDIGGAAPGITPALRSVARTAIEHNCRVVGINNGQDGIYEGDCEKLGRRTPFLKD
ncbi:MAG: 6-phosphofructokinase [Chthoniobacterales bacterium]